jgi:hypothetical protein
MAALDSVFGGIRSLYEKKFDSLLMLSGFFANALLAAGLAYIGDMLGVDLYYAAVFAFGVRLFSNLSSIRHHIISGVRERQRLYRQHQKAKEAGAARRVQYYFEPSDLEDADGHAGEHADGLADGHDGDEPGGEPDDEPVYDTEYRPPPKVRQAAEDEIIHDTDYRPPAKVRHGAEHAPSSGPKQEDTEDEQEPRHESPGEAKHEDADEPKNEGAGNENEPKYEDAGDENEPKYEDAGYANDPKSEGASSANEPKSEGSSYANEQRSKDASSANEPKY